MVCVTGAQFGLVGVIRCQKTSTNDVVYLEQLYLNKVLLGQYNSTEGRFAAYKQYVKKFADDLNKNPATLKQEQMNVETCRNNIKLFDVVSKPGEFGDHTSISGQITV